MGALQARAHGMEWNRMRQQGAYVIVGGAALALWGLYAMWSGWDIVQLERGWALFIAGAVAVSGGAVTMAIGRAIHVLNGVADRLVGDGSAPEDWPAQASSEEPAPAAETPPPAPKPREIFTSANRRPAPVEVDRYTMGDAEYVMFSDGSVEMRRAGRAQRYPSIAALRADAASKRF